MPYLDRTTTIAYRSMAPSATRFSTNCSSVKQYNNNIRNIPVDCFISIIVEKLIFHTDDLFAVFQQKLLHSTTKVLYSFDSLKKRNMNKGYSKKYSRK